MLSLKFKIFSKINGDTTNKITKFSVVLAILLILIPGIILGFFYIFYWGKILPNIKVVGIALGGNTPGQAVSILEKNIQVPTSLFLSDGVQEFEIKSSDIGLKYNFNETVTSAYSLYRTGNITKDLQGIFRPFFNEVNLGLNFEIDLEKLKDSLSVISGQVSEEPINPSVNIVNNQIIIEGGRVGKEVELDKLLATITQNSAFPRYTTLEIPIAQINRTWTEKDIGQIKLRAERLIGKSLKVFFEYNSFLFKDTDLVTFIDKDGKTNDFKVSQAIDKIENQINRKPENSVFVFKEGRVVEFKPSKEGATVDKQELKSLISENIKLLEENNDKSYEVQIPVNRTLPDITTSEVNNLGIKEIIGRGDSKFAGSIASRIHNIGLASSKFNSLLIEPGREVSFNEILGDVSSYTGYKQAYVIRDGKTVLGDGGGVCQVSTTLFRAVLNAGLPITERRSHSYRVSYYEQGSPPGLDATVYAPTTDFKFINDTPEHILIQTLFDPKKYELVFEIYGTNDGRRVAITKPVVNSVIPPPEDLYIEDPTLPTGTIKQIDYKAWGAKVSFNYKVEKNGQIIIDKAFVSNYRPWQAKFLKGVGSN